MIDFRSSKHSCQKETYWINHITFTSQMKQVSLWGGNLEWLWEQQDRDTQMTFHIYQAGQQNNVRHLCTVSVQTELFYHPIMCILHQNLQHMIFCYMYVQQEAQSIIAH